MPTKRCMESVKSGSSRIATTPSYARYADVYHNNIGNYLDAELDAALVEAYVIHVKVNDLWNTLWKSIAGVHMFVALSTKEVYLWDAFELYECSAKTYDEMMPIFWDDIKQRLSPLFLDLPILTRSSEKR